MGFPDEDWKIVDWNAEFEVTPTYPPVWALPKEMTFEEIKVVAEFRR